ncbi:hypothetical protein OPV22_033375 [Ensete ventricosum]|uniref:Uncharacterized protein n=1 Tax=Ensete ventricosum TaxID=4639 RepID=A0AAV8PMJ4_ENSVE|nr:hypothetical protein OPV22_033375 [Ensete ventricosum]
MLGDEVTEEQRNPLGSEIRKRRIRLQHRRSTLNTSGVSVASACSRSEEEQDRVSLVGYALQVRRHVVGEKELHGEDDAAQLISTMD